MSEMFLRVYLNYQTARICQHFIYVDFVINSDDENYLLLIIKFIKVLNLKHAL